MDIVTCRERSRPEIFRERLIDDSLPHLRSEKWNMILRDKCRQIFRDLLPVGSCSYENNRTLRFRDFAHKFCKHFFIYHGSTDLLHMSRDVFDIYLFTCDIFREFYGDDSWSLRSSNFEGIMDERRYTRSTDDRRSIFREWSHHPDDIDNLKESLLRFFDRFLASDDDEWKSRELGIGDSRHHVRSSRSECRESDSGVSRESPMIGCHEYGSLFIASQYKLDRRGTHRFEKIEILFSWYSIDTIDSV